MISYQTSRIIKLRLQANAFSRISAGMGEEDLPDGCAFSRAACLGYG